MLYFKNIGAASAWSRYSMLKSTLFVFQNVDIFRFFNKLLHTCFNMYNKQYTFSSLTSFLKTKCRNYQPKKAATFLRNDVCKFLLEAEKWILQKVVLMMGIFGDCRSVELCKMMDCCSYYFQYTNSFS
jgi:hypothetical protein